MPFGTKDALGRLNSEWFALVKVLRLAAWLATCMNIRKTTVWRQGTNIGPLTMLYVEKMTVLGPVANFDAFSMLF